MSDLIEPPEEEPDRQLALVSMPVTEGDVDDVEPLDVESSLEIIDEEDNLIVLPGLHPTEAEDWLDPVEEANLPFESEAGNEEVAPPDENMIVGAVEALLLTADGPLTENQIRTYLAHPSIRAIRGALYRIEDKFRHFGSGIRLVEVAKGWQLRTDVRCAAWVAQMRGEKPLRLSKAALETLAIVAYRQPVSRAEVEDLRGVDPGGVLRMLCERNLVTVTGRKDVPGRPLLYGTTQDFLSVFGLRDLSDLPTLRDLRELQQDDARDGIGSTDVDYMATLTDALMPSDDEEDDLPRPHLLHPIQEALPLESNDPPE